MALISELITHIKADSSQFTRETNKAKESGNSFASSINSSIGTITAVAAGAVTAFVTIGKVIISQAGAIDELGNKAAKLGVNFQSFQSLAYAATLADVEISTLQSSFSKMSRVINKANDGNKSAAESLAAIGMSAKDLIDLSVDQQFEKISEAISKMGNVTEQRGSVLNIFGRGGLENIRLITSNIAGARREYESFGIAITDAQLEASSALDDVIKKTRMLFSGLSLLTTAKLAGPILEYVESLKEAWKNSEQLRISISGYAATAAEMFSNIAGAITTVLGPVFSFVMKELDFVRKYMGEILSFVAETAGKVQNLIGHGTFNDVSTAKKVDPYLNKSTLDNSAGNAVGGAINTAASAMALSSAMSVQKITLDSATKSISDFKAKAALAAETLGKFTQIREALDAPGKKQASDIINGAVNNQGNILASSDQFNSMFSKAISEATNGDRSGSQSYIKELQGIIDGFKGQQISKQVGTETRETAKFDYDTNKYMTEDVPIYKTGKADTSGLVSALNELKAFLAKEAPKQEVAVKIQVDAGKDFVTTITQDVAFKQAIDDEVANQTAVAARGDLQ